MSFRKVCALSHGVFCSINGDLLLPEDVFMLSCLGSSHVVSKTFITQYAGDFIISGRKPCCPLCKDQEHFCRDLVQNGYSDEPIDFSDFDTLEGLKGVVDKGYIYFAAVNAYRLPDDSKEYGYLYIIARLKEREELNSCLTQTNKTLVHLLAGDGMMLLLKLMVQDGLDVFKRTSQGLTATDIAYKHGNEDTKVYLESLGVPLTIEEESKQMCCVAF